MPASLEGRKMAKTIYAALQVPDDIDMDLAAVALAQAVGIDRRSVNVAVDAISLKQETVGLTAADRLKFEAARRIAADAAFADYDFMDRFEDSQGWESTIPGDEWTRKVYLSNGEEIDGDNDGTWTCTFVVRFTPNTAIVSECYAADAVGNIHGRAHQPMLG
jgi:hypothetical protein